MGFTISKMFVVPNENEAEKQRQQQQQLSEDNEMEILSVEMENMSVPEPEQEKQQLEEEYDDDGLVPGTWGPEPIKIVCEDGVDRSDTKVKNFFKTLPQSDRYASVGMLT